MSGTQGATQKKRFTSEQIKELRDFPIFTEDSLLSFLIKNSLSFKAFKRRATASGLRIPFGYSYSEYQNKPELQSPFNKNNLRIDCSCGRIYITVLFGFHKRKHKVPVCADCYRKIYAYDDEWKANNSKAQKIAQNRPETLAKQVKSQKARYQHPRVLEHYKAIGKKLWEDPEYRKKVVANSSISKAGIYHGISYQSSIELAFILWCEQNNKKIENYSGEGIPYTWKTKQHRYYPDFIVDGNIIVEVKGCGGIYERDYDQNQAKFAALQEWCKSRGLSIRMVFDTDLGAKAIKEARKLHDTLGTKNGSSLQGSGS